MLYLHCMRKIVFQNEIKNGLLNYAIPVRQVARLEAFSASHFSFSWHCLADDFGLFFSSKFRFL